MTTALSRTVPWGTNRGPGFGVFLCIPVYSWYSCVYSWDIIHQLCFFRPPRFGHPRVKTYWVLCPRNTKQGLRGSSD